MKNLLIVGATSAIAQATAACFAAEGAHLFLVGRNAGKLAAVADDLRVRGATAVETFTLDVNAIERHDEMLDAAMKALGSLDAVLIAHGTLSNQEACEAFVEETLKEWSTNFTSTIALLTLLANRFEQQRHGTIAVISSVAGDRGRQSSYVYGAAKAAISTFLQGLRGRMSKANVKVITIKPGTVDTPMTAHLKKGMLFARPERVGVDIHRAMERGTDIIYTPAYWRIIMAIVKVIPERVMKKLSF
jgi:decaprenylphospho-beta-D-erythro-pentofuranosid-2-ulose 2-reductase